MPYTIFCENLPTASAWAQRVSIVDTLDPNLDIRTFRLKQIGFHKYVIQVPENRSFFQARIPMDEQGTNIVVDLSAGVDLNSRQAFWTMNAIDLNTGGSPLSSQQGVLPPNGTNHLGEGFVSYTIKPQTGLATGSLITNNASIVFDNNEAIETPAVTNTVDAVPPSSAVAALPALTLTSTFAVTWSATDDAGGSGVGRFDIYVSDNNGPAVVWLSATTNTTDKFTGQPGHTYAFYSRARDNAGNLETAPAAWDARTLVSGNAPPKVSALPDQFARVGESMVVTNTVLERDEPAERFTWQLLNPPTGVNIQLLGETAAIIRWTPRASQAGTTNVLQVVVTDNGSPSMSVTQAFAVIVAPNMEAAFGTAALPAGQAGCLPLNLYSSVAVTNLELLIDIPAASLSDFSLRLLSPRFCQGNVVSLTSTQLLVTLQACPGQSLQGVQPPVAELCFSVRSNQTSGFLPIQVEQSSARTLDGALITSTRRVNSELAVIGKEPLLIAGLASDGTRTLTLVGRPGATYAIEYATNLAAPVVWTPLPDRITLTTVSTNVAGLTPPPDRVFYRAVEIVAEQPSLEIILLPGGRLRLTLYGQTGKTYAVQYCPALGNPWTDLLQLVLTNSPTSFEISMPGAGTGFYRAIEVVAEETRLEVALLPDHQLRLTLYGQTGKTYAVQYCPALGNPWTDLLQLVLTNSPTSFEISMPGAGTGFYRAVEIVSTQPVLRAVLNSDGTGSLLVQNATLRPHTVQYNTNLARSSDWYSLFDFTPTNENSSVRVTNLTSPIYYRLRVNE